MSAMVMSHHNDIRQLQQLIGQSNQHLAAGNWAEASALIDNAIALAPQHPGLHYQRGLLHHQQGKRPEALQAYQRACQLGGNGAELLNNLGAIYKDTRDYPKAVQYFAQAMSANPDLVEARENLALVWNEVGELEKAAELLEESASRFRYHHKFFLLAAQNTLDLNDLESAWLLYEQASLSVQPATRLRALVYLAVLHYLAGEWDKTQQLLQQSSDVLQEVLEELSFAKIYWMYIKALLDYHAERTVDRPEKGRDRRTLHVIGDSHSLTYQGCALSHAGGTAMNCQVHWMPGCKQWHLANSQNNRFKKRFEKIISSLPDGAEILICLGEIDTRFDEGVLKVWRKAAHLPLGELINKTVDGFIDYLQEALADRQMCVMLQTIPAPNLPDKEMDEILRFYAKFILQFNRRLAQKALAAGMSVLDVWSLTNRGDGIADGQFHLDRFHLRPNAVQVAYEQAFINAL